MPSASATSAKHLPTTRMTMSPSARARMLDHEKIVLRYYNDLGKNRGNCTWGAGILAHKGVCSQEELQRKVSLSDVNAELNRRVEEAEAYVYRAIKVSLTQDQFDALVSLTYNAGVRGMKDTYGFINRSDFKGAAANIRMMNKVTIVEKGKKKSVIARGLIGRRTEESAPFDVPIASSTKQ